MLDLVRSLIWFSVTMTIAFGRSRPHSADELRRSQKVTVLLKMTPADGKSIIPLVETAAFDSVALGE